MVGGIDHEHLVEAVGKVVGLAHIVDRLPHRPERRHGDEIGLHEAAGGVLGIFEAPLERRTLEGRKLGKDVRLVLLVEVLDQIDGFVGVELLQGLGHLLCRHGLDHLVAHRFVKLGQGAGLEVVAKRDDEEPALLGAEQLDQVGEVGFVQLEGKLARLVGVVLLECGGDGMQEIGANAPFLVAQLDLACGVLHGLSDRRVEKLQAGLAAIRERESDAVDTGGLPLPACDNRRSLKALDACCRGISSQKWHAAWESQELRGTGHLSLAGAEHREARLARLQQKGSGILLPHDRKAATAKALPLLLDKERGYRIVQIAPKALRAGPSSSPDALRRTGREVGAVERN